MPPGLFRGPREFVTSVLAEEMLGRFAAWVESDAARAEAGRRGEGGSDGRSSEDGRSETGQDKRAKLPTSKAHISAVFHSFWLIFGRAIIFWNGLEAWMLFPGRARAEHSR